MKRFILLLLFASFTILFYSVNPSIAEEYIEDLALKAAHADTNEASKINNAGVRHFSKEHFSESAEFFEKALKIDPNLVEAHFNLALVYHTENSCKAAADHFRKAAELAPEDSRIQNSKILKGHIYNKAMKMEHGEHKMHESEMKHSH